MCVFESIWYNGHVVFAGGVVFSVFGFQKQQIGLYTVSFCVINKVRKYKMIIDTVSVHFTKYLQKERTRPRWFTITLASAQDSLTCVRLSKFDLNWEILAVTKPRGPAPSSTLTSFSEMVFHGQHDLCSKFEVSKKSLISPFRVIWSQLWNQV